MTRSISYRQLNKFSGLLALLILVVLWQLEFRHTVQSVILYRQHHKATSDRDDLAVNGEYLTARIATVNETYRRYQVDPDEWKNDFWNKVSGIASGKEIGIIYKPELQGAAGTSLIAMQSVKFQGSYRNLISLLDSIDRLENIGRIGHLKMYTENLPGAEATTISLYLRFYSFNK